MTVKTPAAIIYDPTGTHAAEVKPASTAALATDKALVATLSPNGNQLTDTQLRATPVPVSDGGGSITVDGPLTDAQLRASAVPISAASLPLPTGAATQATLVTLLTEADFDARTGNVSPTPTANTILGRLKDLYDRFIAQLPAALVGGRLDTNIGSWLGSTVPTVGQKTKANSIPVAFASDQDAIGIYIGSPAGSRTGLVTASSTLGGGTANAENRVTLTPYNEQTTNAIRSVASANANDTSAGTGARTLRIVYYDQNLAGPFTTDVTMNGTTAVALSVSDVCFVERMEVLTVGSLGANAGVITLYVNNTGGGGAIGTIGYGNIVTGVGDNRTFWGHHYISNDYTATLATFVTSADSGGSGTSAEFYFKVRDPTSSISPNIIRSDLLLATGVIVRTLAFPIKIVGPAVAVIYCVPFVNNTHLNASLDFSEVAT